MAARARLPSAIRFVSNTSTLNESLWARNPLVSACICVLCLSAFRQFIAVTECRRPTARPACRWRARDGGFASLSTLQQKNIAVSVAFAVCAKSDQNSCPGPLQLHCCLALTADSHLLTACVGSELRQQAALLRGQQRVLSPCTPTGSSPALALL